VTEGAEGSLLGSAVVAATGVGLHPDLATASRSMVSISRVYHPDRERHEAYKFYVETYRETYLQLRGLMRAMSLHQTKS
jgi:sugar (pentulose or hexulose) kinase